jgi:hypothetical protein
VSSVGTGQGQAEKLDGPLARGACVVGVAVPTAGAGVAKGFVGGRQETREGGGASGAVDEGLGVCGEPTTGVGVAPGLCVGEPKRKQCARRPGQPRWLKVVGRKSMF